MVEGAGDRGRCVVNTLTSLSGAVLLIACVGGALMYALLMLIFLRTVIRGEGRERAGATAVAYMTVLGSLFAILTGFLINSEYGTLRQAQNQVGLEVAAASQLGYASASLPPADASLIQGSLVVYLSSVQRTEWELLGRDPSARSASADDLALLSRQVFSYGPRPYTPSVTASAMQDALSSMADARRERVVIASQSLPFPLFLLSIVTGCALIAGALIVALRAGPRYALVALGIVLIVGFDLAAILAISGPFAGPFQVSIQPIAQLAFEVSSGQYLPWVAQR